MTLTQIREDLKDIRYYYSRKDIFEEAFKCTGTNSIVDKAKIYNVGDSRVYIQKNNVLKQISLDDSFAQRLFRLGVISAEEAKVHKDRNKLVQHLGIDENELIIEPHISEEIEIYPVDKILLCSDGLTDMVTDERINQILMSGETIDHKSEELLCEALTNGGRDNISIILLEQFIPVEEPEVFKEEHEHNKRKNQSSKR